MRKLLVLCVLGLAGMLPGVARAQSVNLALGSVATASSQESSAYGAANAVDGDATTRWSSAFSDPQTIELDLGAQASISEITPAVGGLFRQGVHGRGVERPADVDATWPAPTNSDGGTDDYPGPDGIGPLRAADRHRPGAAVRLLAATSSRCCGAFTQTAVSLGGSSYSMPEKAGTVTVPVRLNQAATDPGDRQLRDRRRHRRAPARTTWPPPAR